MSKIGRNQRCPCGSGKKYKKCCLGLGKQTRPARPCVPSTAPPIPVPPPRSVLAGTSASMTPYTVARIFEDSPTFAEMRRKRPREAKRYWTPSKIATLDPPAIIERLRELGIDGEAGAFTELAARTTSAWQVGVRWLDTIHRDVDRFATDFICLAACELWKQYLPERPSIEMLDDWMQEGYQLMMQQDETAASDRWLSVWQVIAERLDPHMTTTDAAVDVFDGTQCLFNWVQDVAMTLHNASIDEPTYAKKGARFCQDILDQFSDEGALFRESFRADLGELHARAGNDQQAEDVLRRLIADSPHRAAGYVRLADVLRRRAKRSSSLDDFRQAEELLRDALHRTDNPHDHSVELHLEDLHRDLAALNTSTATPPS